MDPVILEQFIKTVDKKYSLHDRKDMAPYLVENRGLWKGSACLVLQPETVFEVSAIMRLASQTGTAIVPQGGNTGLVGGQIPDGSGDAIVLSLSRLNRIREVDILSRTVTVEAGVILQNLHKTIDDAGLLFPLSLASQGSCQIGGNLASNAGGVAVLSYGSARDLCLGIEVVLPTGEVFDDLRKLKKDNTGYDLKNLFIGSEGTLGVITAAVLKLFPKPKGKETIWVALRSLECVLDFFNVANAYAGFSLTAFEIMNKISLEFSYRHFPHFPCPFPLDVPWYVLMEISSHRSLEDAYALRDDILAHCLQSKIIENAFMASSLRQVKDLWALRESLSEAQKLEGISIKHDIALPLKGIPEFIERTEQSIKEIVPHARIVCFGHVGDGSLHYNIMQPLDSSDFLNMRSAINHAVYENVRALGGSVSAEHGIGQLKRDELIATTPSVALDLMRHIKKTLDSYNIMNPGKVI